MDNVDWMEEFDAFENPTNASKGAGTGGGPKRRNASQIEELEQEMKLLHWHKLANEAALKAALIRTKKLKESSNNPLAAVESRRERAQWMQQIIEEEQNKHGCKACIPNPPCPPHRFAPQRPGDQCQKRKDRPYRCYGARGNICQRMTPYNVEQTA